MTQNDYLPKAFGALLNWLLNFMSYLNANMSRFNITPDQTVLLQTKIDGYQAACVKADNPNAGKVDKFDRREKAAEVTSAARVFVNKYLRYNDAVTDEDRASLGLHIPDKLLTAVLPPTTYPQAVIEVPGIRQLRIRYRDVGSESRAKPKGIHGAEIRYSILPTPPQSINELLCSEFSTRSPHTFTFDENQRGQIIYFCLRWDNNRGQKGPWSEISNAIIP